MRPIKFRGQRLDNGAWLESYSIYQEGGIYLFDDDSPHKDTHFGHCLVEVDSATVGQFTGLHDKNGKEIYEGDVLLWTTVGGDVGHLKIVIYNGCVWAENVTELYRVMIDSYVDTIGNIHDNPELLKPE